MKRFVCIILLLTVVASVGFAENSKPVEILFRGNEWGASYDRVTQSFPWETKFRSLMPCNSYGVMAHLMGESFEPYYKENVACWTNMSHGILDKELTVAGYSVNRVYLHFAYVPEGNGLISSSNPRTALIFAEYRFAPSAPDAMFDSLSEKLIALYGKDYEEVELTGNFSDKKLRIWKGLNDTYASLAVTFEDGVEVRYGYLGGDELLSEAQKARALEESFADPADYDGL